MNFEFKSLLTISSLDFDDIAIWPKEIKICMSLMTALFIFGLSFYWLLAPLLPTIDEGVAQENALKNQYAAKYRIAAHLPAYETQLQRLQQDFVAMLQALPSSNETPGLLDDITDVGTSVGLGFKSLHWQPALAQAFYTELPIHIEVHGTYHDFGVFVTKIASLPRIVTLHDFVIQQDIDGLYLRLQAKTYRTDTRDQN